MNPVAFMASSGKVITADDAEMMLKHSASYFHIQLFSADQLRQAKVETLREAASTISKRYYAHDAANYLSRLADELERS